MTNREIFVGRHAELQRWQQLLDSPQGMAVLVVGPQGIGKTSLVNRMAEIARHHGNLKCGTVRYEVTPTDGVDTKMELMIDHAFEAAQVVAGTFDGTPQRRKQWEALVKALLPKGKELVDLANSLRRDPQRETRDQFVERLNLISNRMPDQGRAVFVIDPEKYMPDGSADAWRLVVKALPSKIKFIFAQRPDGKLVANAEFQRLDNVERIGSGSLEVLELDAVEEWINQVAPDLGRPPLICWPRLHSTRDTPSQSTPLLS
ncbi:MAG: ATP-binding protein [Phycisphaeraceae bacterium]